MEVYTMFQLGEHISFATSERTCTLTIIDQPFAPFTEGAVVLPVRCPELGPDTMVVKIYDVPEDDNGGDEDDGSGEGAERDAGEDHEGIDNNYSVESGRPQRSGP